ncbi:MAG: biotin/lipoyl-containing protein [Methylovirgula sp.]
MKMETVLHAAKDATVKEILIAAGQSVDAKDLLIVLA